MIDLLEQVKEKEEGFASDAQRRAAFASGYKEKGKKKKKEDVDLDEAKATLSRFGGDRLKDSTMNLAKQRGLKVKDLGKDKIEISGNGKVVMALTLALQKKDVKINEDVDLDEKFSPKEIKMAIGVASDPRYKRGNYTGAVNAIEKIKKGLSQHPQVAAVLKRQNEEVDIQEDGHVDVASAVRQCKTIVEDATQMMSKLQGMNPEDSLPSWWTNKLAVASNNMNKMRDYLLVPATEALDKEDEPKVKEIIKKLKKASGAHAGQAKDLEKAVKEEVELDEKSQYGPDIKGEISQLQKMLKGLERGKKTPGRGFAKMKIKELIADLEKRQAQDDAIIKLRGEEVELDEQFDFVLLDKDNKIVARASGKNAKKEMESSKRSAHLPPMRIPKNEVGKMKIVPISPKDKKGIGDMVLAIGEEVELDEAKSSTGYELYHNSFANAMSHAYTMAKKIHRVDVDRNEIDDKVATGPKKPSVGKTNKYRLKGKGGVMQIQVYNSGNKIKPYELNMYKEEVNPLIEASAAQAARDARRAMRRDPDMRQLAFGKDDTATDKDVESAAKNIIMQLRKSVTMGGQKDVEFAKGKQKVPAAVAQKVLDMYMKQRTSSDKGAFQTKIAKSYKDLLNAIKGK